jgi:Uma2 family endonuclease
MSSQPRSKPSREEYLAMERLAECKSEYLDGEVFAMSGAGETHNLIAGNLFAILRAHLRGGSCRAYVSDLRVFVPSTALYTYPDVTVACGERKFADAEVDTLLNPTLIAEVLSPFTENWDRGRKFECYQSIPSLHHYLLIAQDRIHVDLFTRQHNSGWLLTSTSKLDQSIRLDALECLIPATELYESVDF